MSIAKISFLQRVSIMVGGQKTAPDLELKLIWRRKREGTQGVHANNCCRYNEEDGQMEGKKFIF